LSEINPPINETNPATPAKIAAGRIDSQVAQATIKPITPEEIKLKFIFFFLLFNKFIAGKVKAIIEKNTKDKIKVPETFRISKSGIKLILIDSSKNNWEQIIKKPPAIPAQTLLLKSLCHLSSLNFTVFNYHLLDKIFILFINLFFFE